MSKNCKNPPQGPLSITSEGLWSNLLLLPIDDIATTWSGLRSNSTRVKASDLRDMPIRVVLHEGHYEVVDGFKRISRWKQAGVKLVPVLVEHCNDTMSLKQLLLESNSPKRTLTALDEARVVNSLIEDDGLTVRTVANLLGRRKEWIIGRRSLLRLSSHAQELLSAGRINLMVARLLTAIRAEDQDSILAAIEKHSLRMRESQLLIQTWRIASDEEKPGLLADPLFKREQQQSSPTHSARLKALEAKLSAIRNALDEFSSLIIPTDLAEPEQRRLQAICFAIQNQINHLHGFKAEAPADVETIELAAPANELSPAMESEKPDYTIPGHWPKPVFPHVLQCHLMSSHSLERHL